MLTPLIDSRLLINPSQSIFFAAKGIHDDGHDYISHLYQKGVREFVIDRKSVNTSNFPEGNFSVVDDTIAEFQKRAVSHRNKFDIPIVGITGSNGKTIIKEWLSELLYEEEMVCKNPRSFNSQIGVPLSVFELRAFHTLGIFEAGISLPNEMEKIEKIIQPTVGIISNIGSAHDEGFTNRNQKITEKLKLFKNSELIIYKEDDKELSKQIEQFKNKKLSWSNNSKSNADITYELEEKSLKINSNNFKLNEVTLRIPFDDEASIENLCHCITFLIHKGITIDKIEEKILLLKAIEMRLELKKGINNCQIIDDSYSNDFIGLKTALNFLKQSNHHTKGTVILSDLLETGVDHETLYKNIADLLTLLNVNKVIAIGQQIRTLKKYFKGEQHYFENTQAFINAKIIFNNEAILIKGARKFKFENIVYRLTKKQHKTVLEINLESLQQNLNTYKKQIKPTTKIMVMVKAFAYGSGDEVANFLQHNGIDYLAVAYTDEGIELRRKGIKLPIMVMNPSFEEFNRLALFNLEPELYTLSLLKKWVKFGDRKIPIHLKVDTGMHRLGFEPRELDSVIDLINTNALKIASCFSHLAAADEINENQFTLNQFHEFLEFAGQLETKTNQKFTKHILNSSGIISYPEYQFDMVRLGIGLYGYNPVNKSELKTVASLYATISQIKDIKKGSTIGYGRKGKATEDIKIATINIGYADGFQRAFGNGVGEVFLKGKKAPIIGNVCMDMIMADVSDIKCAEGDRVEIFGENISIVELAFKSKTIPYEILTNVSERVKRVYFRG